MKFSRVLFIGLVLSAVSSFGVTFTKLAVVTNSGNGAVTITFTTSGSIGTQVNYGVGNVANSSNPDASGTSHSFTISGLQTGQVYSYQAAATDGSVSSTQKFQLCDSGPNTAPLQGKVNSYYLYGTWAAVWTDQSGTGNTPTLCGAAVTQTVSGSLDYLGSFTTTLPDSLKIVPSPSVWAVTANDVGSIGSITVNQSVTGPSTDMSAALQAAAVGKLQFVWYNPFTTTFFPTLSSGSGTVTSFSSGTLSPLFTTSVATATTTPALSFSLSNSGANTIFGNFTGSSGAPSYNVVSACGDATHALSWVAGTGFACQAISAGTSVNINGSGVSNPNFNGSTPAAATGYVNGTFQVSGSSVSVEVPQASPYWNPSVCVVQGVGPSLGGSIPTTTYPVATLTTAGDTTHPVTCGGAYSYTNRGTSQWMEWHKAIEVANPTGQLLVNFYTDLATSGNVIWDAVLACGAASSTNHPVYGSVQTLGTVVPGAINTVYSATLSNLNITCAAGSTVWLRLYLDSSTTSTGNILLTDVQWTE